MVNDILSPPSPARVPQVTNSSTEQLEEAEVNGKSPLINVCVGLASSLNKSSIIRAANAFLCEAVYTVDANAPEPDPLGLSKSVDSLEELVNTLHEAGYFVWAVDNIEKYGPQNAFAVTFPSKSAFVFGRENDGLYESEINLCDGMVYIPMGGAARSLNVAQAAAVLMSEYTRQQSFL